MTPACRARPSTSAKWPRTRDAGISSAGAVMSASTPHTAPHPSIGSSRRPRTAALTPSGTGVRFDHEIHRSDVTVIMVCKPAPTQADRTRHKPDSTPWPSCHTSRSRTFRGRRAAPSSSGRARIGEIDEILVRSPVPTCAGPVSRSGRSTSPWRGCLPRPVLLCQRTDCRGLPRHARPDEFENFFRPPSNRSSIDSL